MKWLVLFAVVLLSSLSLAQATRPYSEEHSKAKLLTDQQLIDCLRSPKGCAVDSRDYYPGEIRRVLADRKHPDLIIAAYKKADEMDRFALVETLWHIHDPLVETFMRSIAFGYPGNGIDDGSSVFALDYLTERCDLNALARLNSDVYKKYAVMGCSYLNDSVQPAWADAVEAFGRCNYAPAAQNLARSLDSQCLSANKAEQALTRIFPGYCQNYRSVDEQQQCYEKLLHPDQK
ncbi:MAG TPA: hypothetical protein VMH04_19180 [Candidatus Solibacter sp.]|nr:hypothetical protein [Candidatus Solibacter sp.]